MKIIFLDIDGVLNNKKTVERHQGYIGINPFLVMVFNRIIFATDAQIVLSSSWRLFPDGVEEVERRVMKCMSLTGRSETGFRGDEIKKWLEDHKDLEIESYAILDDYSDFYPDQPLFKTTWEEGLTQEVADKVVAHLNKQTSSNG